MAGGYGGVNPGGAPPGPREGNRKRNTVANMLSRTNIDYKNPGGLQSLPPMDPASTSNYYTQLALLGQQARMTSAQLRTERVGLRSAFGAERAGIVLGRKRGIADVESQMLDRGMTGSSAEVVSMADVRADAASQLQVAKNNLLQALGQNRLQQQAAGLDYYTQAAALQGDALAKQQMLAAQQMEQNLVISGQETQMDYLKRLYKQQLGGLGGGAGLMPNGKSPSKKKIPMFSEMGL